MDAQTIAIIGVGATLIAVFMPPLIMLIRRVDDLNNQVTRLTQVVTALANHRHDSAGIVSCPHYRISRWSCPVQWQSTMRPGK